MILDEIKAMIALDFAGVVPADPADVAGFGADLDCSDDIDPSFGLVADAKALAQAVYRRLRTPRGSLLGQPNYGVDLQEILSKGMTPEDLAAVPAMIRGEVLKEERIQSCTVQATPLVDGALMLGIRCVSAAGPFSLTINASKAAITLVEVK